MAFPHRLILGAALLLAASTASAQVQLSLKDGRVTLVAKDATVRQILSEWARVGQTRIVNVERIPGGPVTLQFTSLPEEEALDILLRAVSGYMAAPRPTSVSNLSRYDRIMVMPSAPAPRAVAAAAPVFQPAAPPPVIQEDEPESPAQRPGQPVPTVVAPARGPIFQTFPQPPQPQAANPPLQSGTPNTNDPPENPVPPAAATPVGVPRPGMVIPAPAQQPGPAPNAQPVQR